MISRTVTSIKLKPGLRKPAVATNFRPMALNAPPTKVSYTDFIKEVKDHSVIEAHYSRTDSTVKYLTVTGDYAETNVVPNDRFWDVAIDNGLNLYIDDVTMDVNVLDVAGTVFWFAFMIFLIRGVMDAQKSPGGIPGNPFTRNTDFDMDREITTRFEDVEGIDNAKDELAELVDFLKNPGKYALERVPECPRVPSCQAHQEPERPFWLVPSPASPAFLSSSARRRPSWKCLSEWVPRGSATCSSRHGPINLVSYSLTKLTPLARSGAGRVPSPTTNANRPSTSC